MLILINTLLVTKESLGLVGVIGLALGAVVWLVGRRMEREERK